MLKVEDCLLVLNEIALGLTKRVRQINLSIPDKWDHQFITDVGQHALANNAISTTQAKVVLKLITRYRPALEQYGLNSTEISQLILIPSFRRTPYESIVLPREVRYLGDNKLAFRCKYNKSIIDDIKKLRNELQFETTKFPLYTESKIWVVEVNSLTIHPIMTIIKRYGFDFDSAVEQFLLRATNANSETSYVAVSENQATVVVNNDEILNNWLKAII